MRILVSGMVAGDPHQGGATWAVLQYVLGLRALGHDVMLVEPVDELSPERVGYFQSAVVEPFDLADRAALLVAGSDRTAGITYTALTRFARDADLLLNVSGMLRDETLRERALNVYLDLDPAFNQLWAAAEGVDAGFEGHERFVTVGLAIGDPDCPVPDCALDWITTVQPVVLDLWPPGNGVVEDAFTTVGNWRGYGSIHHEGVHYGQRVHSLRELIDLPARTDARLRLALAIHPEEEADLDALARNGWQILDPAAVAGDPDAYRAFVSGSRAELGVAKSGYVASRCGWFSDRSACYLASGRPVVAQETGFSRFIPVGDGLLAYSTVEDAAGAIDAVRSRYAEHARAARRLAEDVFDSRIVLSDLLDALGGAR